MEYRYTLSEIISLIETTLNTIKEYNKFKSRGLKIPSSLTGILGEFIVFKELLEFFGEETDLKYYGGLKRSFDISIDRKRIQVKTTLDKQKFVNKNWSVELEGMPDISVKSFEEDKFDIIIWLVIYLSGDASKIENINTYVLNKRDFNYFSTIGSFSGKRMTIAYILRKEGVPSTKRLQRLLVKYDNIEYSNLFEKSKDNFGKIQY